MMVDKKKKAVAPPKSKLSSLGQQLEDSLVGMLRELDATEDTKVGEVTVTKPKYSLLDRLRVYDRALKLEAIKAKVLDDEGDFFSTPADSGGTDE